jgi:hypothetical protein
MFLLLQLKQEYLIAHILTSIYRFIHKFNLPSKSQNVVYLFLTLKV